MKNLNDIFAKPYDLCGIGLIYPIRLKDYDKFAEVSSLLYISKNHFAENNHQLLELIYFCAEDLGYTIDEVIQRLETIFTLVFRKQVKLCLPDNSRSEGYKIDENNMVTTENYDAVREIIMKQNIILEQKIYKTKLMNDWATKAMKAKQKNAPNITLEDIVSTVSVGCHKHYFDLEDYTIYQIYSDFYRLRKMIKYDSSIQYKCAGSDLTLEDYAENLDLYHNPYDDLFVSSDKLKGLNQAVKQ